jgi:hypothetical protein
LAFAVCGLVGGKILATPVPRSQPAGVFVGPIKLFWGQNDPYARVTAPRAVTREQTTLRHEQPPQHDLPRQQADYARLARAAEMARRQIEQMDPLFKPVE